MDCSHCIGKVSAVAVALVVWLAVAIAPGAVWADGTDGTGDGSPPGAGPSGTQPQPATPPAGGNDGGTGTGEPGSGQTSTTTTTGTQSTTVIGGGDSPEVTISASTVDNSSPSGTTASTPQADPIGDTVRQFVHLWDESTQMIASQAAQPSTVPDAVGERAGAPSPTTAPTPTAVVAEAAPAAAPQPSLPATDGGSTPAPMIAMLKTLAGTVGTPQFGPIPMSLAAADDTQAVMAARFAADVPKLDFPEPPQAKLPDKSLWTIPGRSSAEKLMMAATFLVAVSVLAALVISYARTRALRMPSGIWRAAGG